MELFTEVEFNHDELDKVFKVMHFLTKEGWEVVNTVENLVTKPGQDKEIKAIKYKLRREI
jgi:hypothetical protein